MSEQEDGMDEETQHLLDEYLVFKNGAGFNVYTDIMETFHELHNDVINEELAEIPHPYREYVIKGMRMVTQRIKDTIKLAENQAGVSEK